MGRGGANQWDKHSGANPQFSLCVLYTHVCQLDWLTGTRSLVGKARTRAETRELRREFLYSNEGEIRERQSTKLVGTPRAGEDRAMDEHRRGEKKVLGKGQEKRR